MIHHVDRIEHLVRTLLTYAGDPADRQASADLGAVLREAAQRFAPDFASHDKQLTTAFDGALGAVPTDPIVLAQVFNSLIANAAEATKPGDQVTISARRDGQHATVEVIDTGSGIEPEKLQDIFRPFFTTKPRGMGLGLALVRRIVLRLGGEVKVDSTPGVGTTVRLRLPLA